VLQNHWQQLPHSAPPTPGEVQCPAGVATRVGNQRRDAEHPSASPSRRRWPSITSVKNSGHDFAYKPFAIVRTFATASFAFNTTAHTPLAAPSSRSFPCRRVPFVPQTSRRARVHCHNHCGPRSEAITKTKTVYLTTSPHAVPRVPVPDYGDDFVPRHLRKVSQPLFRRGVGGPHSPPFSDTSTPAARRTPSVHWAHAPAAIRVPAIAQKPGEIMFNKRQRAGIRGRPNILVFRVDWQSQSESNPFHRHFAHKSCGFHACNYS